MKNKRIIILIAMFAILLLLLLVYKNSIVKFFNNKEWELTETIGTVSINNHYAIGGTSSNLLIVGNNYITGYANNAKEIFDESISLKDAIMDTKGEYCIIGEKNGTKTCLISANAKVWENEIQGNILGVSVNKNGYTAIIYKQPGYKSVIKVMTPEGKELFTNYFVSTYALDVEISNDNKALAIAVVNTEGINVQCSIKLVDMNNIEQENVQIITLDNDILLTDIEYNDKNQLLVLTDISAMLVVNNILKEIEPKLDNDVSFATIENSNELVYISKVENGLFDVSYQLNIDVYKEEIKKNTYPLRALPSQLAVSSKYIALLLDNELMIINLNGRLVKHSRVYGNINSILFFDNGNTLALIYRDKIEFVKI